MREPLPQIHLTHQPLGHMTTQRRYISTFIRYMDPKLSRILVTLVITKKVCAEGNWLIQVPDYYYPSLSKKMYNISNVKEAVGMQRKACACRK